jgi:hypothetical protein
MSKHGMLGSLLGLILVAGLGHTAGATDAERELGRDAQPIEAAGGLAHQGRRGSPIGSPASRAASVTAQRVQNRWGWGETLIANRLAQQIANKLLAQPGNTLSPAQALA